VSTGRNAGIDLLRGVAVLLVILRHAFPELFGGAGIVGVVMFFALSGHLITGVLLDELTARGSIRLRHFAWRRAVRLVPALVTMMACFVLVTLVFDPLGDKETLPRTVLVALTWTANLPFDHGSDAIFHLWTLAMEEQFYLVWPALLLLAWRWRKIRPLLIGAGAISLALCVLSLLWAGEYPDLVYTFPTSWTICFVIGAASRVLRDRIRVPGFVTPIGCAVLAALSVIPLRGHAATYLIAAPVIAIVTALFISRAWRHGDAVPFPAVRPLVALGIVSYAAYLWNYPITLWLRGTFPAAELVAALLTVVAATLSWWLVEKPISRLARSSPRSAVR